VQAQANLPPQTLQSSKPTRKDDAAMLRPRNTSALMSIPSVTLQCSGPKTTPSKLSNPAKAQLLPLTRNDEAARPRPRDHYTPTATMSRSANSVTQLHSPGKMRLQYSGPGIRLP
jgi:hypothetical protein